METEDWILDLFGVLCKYIWKMCRWKSVSYSAEMRVQCSTETQSRTPTHTDTHTIHCVISNASIMSSFSGTFLLRIFIFLIFHTLYHLTFISSLPFFSCTSPIKWATTASLSCLFCTLCCPHHLVNPVMETVLLHWDDLTGWKWCKTLIGFAVWKRVAMTIFC